MSDGEILAPAQAAGGKDFASAFGLHALAETVRARAFQSFGLVDSLHCNSLCLKDSGGYYTLKDNKRNYIMVLRSPTFDSPTKRRPPITELEAVNCGAHYSTTRAQEQIETGKIASCLFSRHVPLSNGSVISIPKSARHAIVWRIPL